MSRFNLVDEKWIPVRFLDGARSELGIRDTLLRSAEISAIEDASPLVVAGLHRLLLAVLYRALEGPTDIDQAKALFLGGLPNHRISSYLEYSRGRFWLFDVQCPFYQVAAYEPQERNGKKQWRYWPALAAEHNASNAKVLFDHVDVSAAGSISAGKAARWLVACQTFALGGGNSDFVYTKSAPSASGAMVVPLGLNLHDTLLLCLVPENKEVLAGDRPIWEQTPASLVSLKTGIKRPILGIADLYTWLSRSIKLRPNDNGETTSELAFASGVECSSEDHVDPMMAYRIDDKRGKVAIQFRERGLWRDFDSLLPDAAHLAPRVIENATTLGRLDRKRFPRSVIVLGQASDKAKIEYWRMERFALPEALAQDRMIRSEIRQLLSDGEEAHKSLSSACRSFARDLLSRGEREPLAKDVSGFVAQMPASTWYWSGLESRFHEILSQYTQDREADDIRYEWLKSVRSTLRASWQRHTAAVSLGDAWAIRALVKAERSVGRKLRDLKEEIQKLKPQENTQ